MKKLLRNMDKIVRQEIIIYVIIWSLVMMFPLINGVAATVSGAPFMWDVVFRWWLGVLLYLGLFLVHRLVLVPHFFLKNRIKIYTVLTVSLLICFGFSQHCMLQKRRDHFRKPSQTERVEPPPGFRPYPRIPLMLNTGLAALMLGFTLSVMMMFKNQREKEMRKMLENLRLQDELKYLRSQVNPHFFMNMLNNIHAMVEIDPHKAQEVIIGLSKLMRYSLYDAEKDLAPLNDEVDFLKNYINLMMVRYPEDVVEINMNIPAHPSSSVMIPPLLFMPLIENAFKHGVSYKSKTVIDVAIREKKDMILFVCSNTKANHSIENQVGGLGLENVRRRLSLRYKDMNLLEIDNDTEKYTVTLKIPII